MNRDKILDTKDTVEGLCKLARQLGYKDPCCQLMNSDGSVVGDLLYLLEDNPGLCATMIEWLADNHGSDEEDDDPDYDDVEDNEEEVDDNI